MGLRDLLRLLISWMLKVIRVKFEVRGPKVDI